MHAWEAILVWIREFGQYAWEKLLYEFSNSVNMHAWWEAIVRISNSVNMHAWNKKKAIVSIRNSVNMHEKLLCEFEIQSTCMWEVRIQSNYAWWEAIVRISNSVNMHEKKLLCEFNMHKNPIVHEFEFS